MKKTAIISISDKSAIEYLEGLNDQGVIVIERWMSQLEYSDFLSFLWNNVINRLKRLETKILEMHIRWGSIVKD